MPKNLSVLPILPISIANMTEDFSPKALVVIERLLELLGLGGVAS